MSGLIVSAAPGATTVTISGLSSDVTIKAGQRFLVSATPLVQAVAAADAAADNTGVMTVTLKDSDDAALWSKVLEPKKL